MKKKGPDNKIIINAVADKTDLSEYIKKMNTYTGSKEHWINKY